MIGYLSLLLLLVVIAFLVSKKYGSPETTQFFRVALYVTVFAMGLYALAKLVGLW